MYRLIEKFVRDSTILPRAILLMLAVALLLTGIYAIGPWYVGGPTTAMGVVLEADLVRALPASFYIISGAFAMFGVLRKQPRWRYRGAFLCTLSYTFLVILRLLTFGPFPIIWLFTLALGLISAIIYLWESGREVE